MIRWNRWNTKDNTFLKEGIDMKRWKAVSLFTIGAGAFGFTPIFVKLSFSAGYSLAELNVSQMMIAAFTLWLIALFKHRQIHLTKKQLIRLLSAGSLTGITSIFYYGSMQYVPASIAIILLFQFVWIGVIYEWLFDKNAPTLTTYISVVLTLFGVFFAADVLSGEFFALSFIGVVLGICSAFSYAGFIYVSGRVATQIEPLTRTAIMMTGALLLMIIVFPPTFLFTDAIISSVWFYGAGAALFGAILPPILFSLSAPHLPTGLATILGSIELPVAVVMTSMILSETVTVSQWFGIVLILLAISYGEIKIYVSRLVDKKSTPLQ